MWCLSALIFFVAKLLIVRPPHNRSTIAFIALWPGFDFKAWMRPAGHKRCLLPHSLINLAIGGVLVWAVARQCPTPFVSTWTCMVGFVILLHSGLFTMLAAFWRGQGRDVIPLMNAPLLATSVSEFWGKRWNLGFRDLAHTLIFKPMLRRFGKGAAITLVFFASGLAHELVITVPAQGGYGGPTLYFLLQAIGMGMERAWPSNIRGFFWRIRTMLFLILPLPLLFPPVFVDRVMHPFFSFVHALP